jgi:Protein of unknown function (DUF3515)
VDTIERSDQPAADVDVPGRPLLSWQVVAALVVVVLAIAVAVTLGLVNRANPVVDSGPLPVATVGQPGADSAACMTLMPRLPAELAGSKTRAIEGGGDGIAAWGDPAVILRCGLETPEELTCSSALTQVDGVSWLQLAGDGLPETTYIAADRSVRIAVTVPAGSGTGPIQQISDVVSAALPVRAPCSSGVLLPTDTK